MWDFFEGVYRSSPNLMIYHPGVSEPTATVLCHQGPCHIQPKSQHCWGFLQIPADLLPFGDVAILYMLGMLNMLNGCVGPVRVQT
jgi:hypothetical protein